MKNKGIVYIFISIILIVIACFFCFTKFESNSIDENLLNKKWYHYDYSTGYYNTFYIDLNSFNYDVSKGDYSSCTNYTYNKSSNELRLNCDEKISIVEVKSNRIVLNIDSKNLVFYDNVDSSLNYEFESFYKKSISEYKKEKSVVTELIKINYNRFFELFKENEFSYFIFYDNACTSVDCVLSLDVIEKWINVKSNIYYVNINEFSDEQMLNLNKINKSFSIDRTYYNGIYPRVIVINNGIIHKDFEIKCKGFDCSSYDKVI